MLRGGLFTRFFLEDGIRELTPYRRLEGKTVLAFAEEVHRRWTTFLQMPRPNESETESEFINPMLGLLGWEHLPQQQPGRGRRDVADALLFLNDESKARARPLPSEERFRIGSVVVENEARDTRLDRAGSSGEAPSSQLLRYLGRAEAVSGGRLRWGLLTKGRFGGLYWAHARARAEGFIEIELPALLDELRPTPPAGADPDHW